MQSQKGIEDHAQASLSLYEKRNRKRRRWMSIAFLNTTTKPFLCKHNAYFTLENGLQSEGVSHPHCLLFVEMYVDVDRSS